MIKKEDKLKSFYHAYRRYHINRLKKDFGKDTFISSETFEDFLQRITNVINEHTSMSCSGHLQIETKFSVKLIYPSSFIGEEPAKDLKEIEMPIIIASGSCGNKHLLLAINDEERYDLGAAKFENKCLKDKDLKR